FSADLEKRFKANKGAWKLFQAMPPGYQRLATFYVMNAKKEETRLKRLELLIKASEQNVRVGDVIGKASQRQSTK
ncbi:MAG TPA: YdeI/OmpD-associated family protein, partial [Pyrinomonadaceae bacterium]|nr:YdeI/OmpD-associated family protein [Pyrinomonadaceae bacterium]